MFDRFTDRARKVMGFSRQECQRFHHDYIGPEHILLGLILDGCGVAADVLKNLDVDPKRLRREVEKHITHGNTMVTMGQIPFTPRAKRVLEFSFEEANDLGHNYIGTEHLLLGLIREEEGFAAQALRTLGVGLEAARGEVAKLLAAEVPVPEVPGPQVSGPLTDRARRVMRIAVAEAARFRHSEIGTEHILLGLIGEVAPGVLSKVLLLRLRVDTEKLMTPGTEPVPKPRFTPGVKKAIKLALEAARDQSHGGAGPEHLLLGEKEGIAARVLSAAGITAGEVLEAIAPARKPPAPGLFWFDRLGDRNRRAMGLAREEALRLTHDYIGTEHMLLGLVSADSDAAEMLRRLGADPARVRAEIEKRITPGNTMVTTGALPFTPAMKRVLELTREEVNALGHDRVRDEHLLLGLLREEKGTAAQVLAALGVTADAVRKAIGPPAPPG
jgi:ATP-dependent Clp protease ATP-binding subunit ClpA